MFFLCNNFPLLTYFLVRSLNLGEGREKQVRNQVMSGTSGNSLKGWSTRFFVASRTRNFTFPLVTSWWDCAYRYLQLVYQYILGRYIYSSMKFRWNFTEISLKVSLKFQLKFQKNFKRNFILVKTAMKFHWNLMKFHWNFDKISPKFQLKFH